MALEACVLLPCAVLEAFTWIKQDLAVQTSSAVEALSLRR